MSAGEVRVRTIAEGDPGAPLVVFAHGLEDSWEGWWGVARRMTGYRIVALDLPWRPGNDYRWRSRDPGAWLAEGLDRVGGRCSLLVAHSFGANAALRLLACDDTRCPPLVTLICPLYCPPEQHITWSVFDRARRTFDRHLRDGLRVRLGERVAALEPEILNAMMGKAIDRVGPAGFLAVFEEFVASGRLDLSAVGAATLVLAGGADPTMSHGAAAALGRDMPSAQVFVDNDFDHFCHVRRGDEIAAHIARFCAAAAPARHTEGASS